MHVLDRLAPDAGWRDVIAGVEVMSTFSFDAAGTGLIGTTTLDAPKGRVVVAAARRIRSDPAEWTTVVPERDVVLGALAVAGDEILVVATSNAVDSVERWSPRGIVRSVRSAMRRDSGVASVVSMSADRPDGPRRGRHRRVRRAVPLLALLSVVGPGKRDARREERREGCRDPSADRQPGDVPVARRDRDRDVPHPSRRRRSGPGHADDPQRLRRLRHRRDAGVVADDRRVVRARRAVRDRRTARRDRARRDVARRRPTRATSRTCSTTSTPRPTGWSRPGARRGSGWRSTAGRTAGCSSAPPSRNGPTCAPRCRAACRCST